MAKDKKYKVELEFTRKELEEAIIKQIKAWDMEDLLLGANYILNIHLKQDQIKGE